MTNNSIFTKVLALVLCLVMVLGTFTACFGNNDVSGEIDTEIKDVVDNEANDGADDVEGGNENVDNGNTEEKDPNEIFSASANIEKDSLIYGALANGVLIGDHTSYSAIIPADVKVEAGAKSLSLSIKNVEESNESFADFESVQSLDVHVSGVAADNTVPMIVNLGAVLEAGLGATELKLYHMEDGVAVLMTRVDSLNDFAIHNQYYYNAETGEVSIYVASFSVFVVVEAEADVWDGTSDTAWYNDNDTSFTLATAEQLAGFRDLVDSGNTFEGKTVTLGTDIDLDKIPFDPIGFGYYKDEKNTEDGDTNTVFLGTFDGGNHTIYNLYQNCWELDTPENNYATYTYSTAGAGLFASIKNATIKNIAISYAEVVFECVDMGVLVGYAQGECHFENIVITNANIANYNRYTGGLVGEVSYGVDNNGDGYSHTFKNITIDSTVTVSGLWGSFGCGMGGVIGGKWGDATVLMENVVSAPVMDVYNDVVSAYQWYAFRGCGMLIGHTEEPYSDGRTSGNATASFLTCKNVSVFYGDWVEYNYYQFAEQTDAEGNTLWYSNYPWVRAEAGVYCDAFSNIRYGIPLINGVKVTELSEEEFNEAVTDYTTITFDQLYGADRGMYGTNKHLGVNVSYSSPKTYYINNNLGWTNLKLTYNYNHGEETWTPVPDGVELFESNGVYRVDLPVGAISFTITADGGFSVEFAVADLTHKETYNVHDHVFEEGSCSCGATQISNKYEFTFGENTSSGHKESTTAQTKYTETNSAYTLSITNASKFYPSSNDEKGNSCLKLGSGDSTIGSFSFVVPDNVNQVIIYVAGYKAKTATIDVNGDIHTITTLSNNGEYTSIAIDTSKNKTVNFATTTNGNRCMINTIIFVATEISCVECVMKTVEHKDASCDVAGYTLKKCSVCGKETRTEYEALTHDYSGANPYICVNGCGVHNLPDASGILTIQHALWIAETLENGEKASGKYIVTCVIDDEDHPSKTGTTYVKYNGTEIKITDISNADDTVGYEDFVTKIQHGDEITVSVKIEKNDTGVVLFTNTLIADHIDDNEDDYCDYCGTTLFEQGGETPNPDPETPVTTTVSKSHTDIATIAGVTAGQTTGKIDGQVIKLDDYISIRCDKESAGTVPTIFSESIRLYQGGATLTITSAEGYTIKTVKIKVANNSSGKGPISVAGGTASELTNLVYTITANAGVSEIVITTTGTTSSTRLYVANIEVEYTKASDSEGGETTCEHTNTTTNTVAATCTKAGSTTVTCDDCDTVLSTEEIPATGNHIYEDGKCTGCGAEDPNAGGSTEPTEPITLATFTLGANGSASHNDGSEKSSYSETVNGYTLSITGGSKMYTGARDAKGNSALKLGTSSAAGKFSFTVPENVTEVVIYVAKYKSNTSKVTINGTTHTLTKNSNDGEYDVITIDTTTTKTISLTTISGGYRAMVNTIEFIGNAQ